MRALLFSGYNGWQVVTVARDMLEKGTQTELRTMLWMQGMENGAGASTTLSDVAVAAARFEAWQGNAGKDAFVKVLDECVFGLLLAELASLLSRSDGPVSNWSGVEDVLPAVCSAKAALKKQLKRIHAMGRDGGIYERVAAAVDAFPAQGAEGLQEQLHRVRAIQRETPTCVPICDVCDALSAALDAETRLQAQLWLVCESQINVGTTAKNIRCVQHRAERRRSHWMRCLEHGVQHCLLQMMHECCNKVQVPLQASPCDVLSLPSQDLPLTEQLHVLRMVVSLAHMSEVLVELRTRALLAHARRWVCGPPSTALDVYSTNLERRRVGVVEVTLHESWRVRELMDKAQAKSDEALRNLSSETCQAKLVSELRAIAQSFSAAC